MRRQLNIRLALYLVGTLLLLGVGLHALHAYQVDRNAEGLLRQAERALDKHQPEQALRLFDHYLVYRPADIDARARHALLLEKHAQNGGDRLRAALALQEVLRIDPARTDVRYRFIHCLANLQRLPEAIAQAQTLLPSWPRKGEIEHLIGWCHEAQGKYEKAADWFKKAIAADPAQIDSYVLLSEVCHVRLEDPEKAAEVMDQLVQANPQSYRAYLLRSRFLQRRNDVTQAEKDLQRAVELAPSEPAVLLAAADWAQGHGKADQARSHLAAGLKLHAHDEGLYKALATLELADGKRAAARDVLRRGLRAAPHAADLAVLLIDLLIDEGALAEAEQQLSDLKRHGSASPLVDYFQARLLVQRRQCAQAIPLLERVRNELGPRSEWTGRVHALLGVCYRQTGDIEQQLASFRRAAHLEPTWTAPRFGAASALLALGRLEEAHSELKQVADSKDAPPEVWAELARCLLLRNLRLPAEQRKWDDIEPLLARSEKSGAAVIDVAILRAEMLAVQQRLPEAQKLLERARGDTTNSVLLECALADVARRQNQLEQALAILDRAERKLGDSLEIRQARLRLWSPPRTPRARQALADLSENLQTLPVEGRVRLLRELAETWARLGDTAHAETLWRRLIQEQPRDLPSRFRILELQLHAGRLDRAASLVAELRRLEGEQGVLWHHGTAALLLAESPGQPKKLEQARKHLVDARRLQRDWGKLPLLEGRIDEMDGKLTEAIQNYQSAFDLGERSPRFVYHLLQLLQDRRSFTAAEDILRKYEEHQSLPSELARLGAEIAIANNHVERALGLAKEAVAADSRDYRDYLWLARIDEAARQPREAESKLRRAVALASHTPETWVALISHLVRTGQRHAAESVLREARQQIAPDRAPFILAPCHDALGQPAEADKLFRQAIDAQPNDFTLLAAAADFYRHHDEEAKAAPLLEKLLQPDLAAPVDLQIRARRQLGFIVARSDQARALDLLAFNVGWRGNNIADERARALVLGFALKKQLQAMQMFEATLPAQPATPDELFHFTRLCEAAGNDARSRTILLELVTNHPNEPQYLARYIRAQVNSGDLNDARSYFLKLEQLEPDSPRTRDVQRLLGYR